MAVAGRVTDTVRRLLGHPLARGLDPDDEAAPAIHRRIIASKPLLTAIYGQWYDALAREVGPHAPVLELGSGAGFFAEHLPGLITSDVRPTPAARLVLDGHALPFGDAGLGGIAMTNVLHHLPDAGRFFAEAARVVRPDGVIAMIEPWVSTWSRRVYARLHHEPFDPEARDWAFRTSGPLSGANGALPWMLFSRDLERFTARFPAWRVRAIRPGWPVSYLVSGGVSMRCLVPTAATPLIFRLDRRLSRHPARWAMFALIVLERTRAR